MRSPHNEPISLHLRNAPTKLMKDLGYAKGYTWSEEKVGSKEGLSFLPEKVTKNSSQENKSGSSTRPKVLWTEPV